MKTEQVTELLLMRAALPPLLILTGDKDMQTALTFTCRSFMLEFSQLTSGAEFGCCSPTHSRGLYINVGTRPAWTRRSQDGRLPSPHGFVFTFTHRQKSHRSDPPRLAAPRLA